MSLVACKECSQQISTTAKVCPQCGAKSPQPPKKTSFFTWFAAGVCGLIVVATMNSGPGVANTPSAPKAPAPTPATNPKRDAQLQAAGAAVLTLRRGAKDPESFILKSADVMDNGTACLEYRAKNSFGAVLPGSAVLTATGKLLVHESHGNTFVAAWNKECTKSGGDDIAPLMHRLFDIRVE